MPPKGSATTKLQPMRLPPLPKLRVRRPNQADANPCLALMSSVLTCWASAGYNVAGCQTLETQLRACMDMKTDIPEEEYDQLPLVTNVPEYCWAKEEEVNREQTSWTIQLEEKRNRFEESLKRRNQV